MALSFLTNPALVNANPDGAAGMAIPAGPRRMLGLAVFYEAAAAPTPGAQKGAVDGFLYVRQNANNGATFNGIDLFIWPEADVADMADSGIEIVSSAYTGSVGYAEFALRDCSVAIPGYGYGKGFQVAGANAGNPYIVPPACDLAIGLWTLSSGGVRVTGTSPQNFTSFFDADLASGALGAACRRFFGLPSNQVNSTYGASVTRSLFVVAGFDEDLGVGGGSRVKSPLVNRRGRRLVR